MRFSILLIVVAVIVPATIASGQNQRRDSFCELPFWAGDKNLWRVDDDLADDLEALDSAAVNGGGSRNFSDSDAVNMVDQTLQNIARWSRQQSRQRVKSQVEDCTGDRCVVALSDSEAANCLDNQNALAFAGCNGFNCTIHFCKTGRTRTPHSNPTSGQNAILLHEMGHVRGLKHPAEQPNSCAPNCICALGCPANSTCNTATALCLEPDCGGSDGCEGEMMCPNVPTGSGTTLYDGDSEGFRERTGGQFYDRRVYSSSRLLTSSAASTVYLGGNRRSVFAPRIDCASSNNPSFGQCAAVINYGASGRNTKIVRLDGWSASGWSTNNSQHFFTRDHNLEPDIAVSDDGREAFVTRTSSNNNFTFIRHVDLATNTAAMASLGYRSERPPRVSWIHGEDKALVLGFSLGTWRMHQVRISGANLSVTPIATTSLNDVDTTSPGSNDMSFIPGGDFDFDCHNTRCTIVSNLWMDSSAHDPGNVMSRSFEIGFSTISQVDPTWSLSSDSWANDINSIVGVALRANDLSITAGAQAFLGNQNSRALYYNGSTNVTSNGQLSYRYRSDAQSCSSAYMGGYYTGGSTTWGGESLAYCPSCGRLIGLRLGRPSSGGSKCY